MSGTNNSSSNTSQMAVPQAKEAMNRFKQEVASEIGVPLKEGYNGDLTSAQAGSIGGEMVKKMIMRQQEPMKGGSNSAPPQHKNTPYLTLLRQWVFLFIHLRTLLPTGCHT